MISLTPLNRGFQFARIAFINHITNRGRFWMRFIFCMFFVFIFIELWRAIFRENLASMPFTLLDVSWYCAFTQMFLFMSSRLFLTIEDDVRSGNIAYFLNKPMPYVWMRLCEGIGGMSANVLAYGSIGIFVTYLWIGQWPANAPALPLVLVTLWFGSILHLIFQVATGLTALWLHDAEAVYRLYQKFLIVCGGLYVPISIYPDWAQDIIAYTPFGLFMAAPAQLIFDTPYMPVHHLIIGQITWIIAALGLAYAVYALALRKVEVNGG